MADPYGGRATLGSVESTFLQNPSANPMFNPTLIVIEAFPGSLRTAPWRPHPLEWQLASCTVNRYRIAMSAKGTKGPPKKMPSNRHQPS